MENFNDWVIMRKSVFLGVCKRNSVEGWTPEKSIQKHLEGWTLLGDFWDFVIVDRKFYDISKLVGEYSVVWAALHNNQ